VRESIALACGLLVACGRYHFDATGGSGDAASIIDCGDGVVGPTEGCDDGNVAPGDGCSAQCQVEATWTCRFAPSFCAPSGFVPIAPGTFLMGSAPAEAGRGGDELQHQVTLTRGFWIGSTEITQAQFTNAMSWNPSSFAGCPQCPVDNVGWFDVVAYANQLTSIEGGMPCYGMTAIQCRDGSVAGSNPMACMNPTAGGIQAATVTTNGVSSVYACTGYRLATEAEWEYAARAGDPRATYAGDLDASHLACEQPNPVLDPIGWFCGNAAGSTHVATLLLPNAWGLYGVYGNCSELVYDWYGPYPAGPLTDPEGPPSGTDKPYRGGPWFLEARRLRAAYRDHSPPDFRDSGLASRLVRTAR
jgi:cysteine-rich repeat protein